MASCVSIYTKCRNCLFLFLFEKQKILQTIIEGRRHSRTFLMEMQFSRSNFQTFGQTRIPSNLNLQYKQNRKGTFTKNIKEDK